MDRWRGRKINLKNIKIYIVIIYVIVYNIIKG